jgi:hypothetical protein
VLIGGLPPDSAMHRAYPHSAGWEQSDHLLADLVDGLNALWRLTAAVNSKDGRYDPPTPVRRPGDEERLAAEVAQTRKTETKLRSIVAQLLPPERR